MGEDLVDVPSPITLHAQRSIACHHRAGAIRAESGFSPSGWKIAMPRILYGGAGAGIGHAAVAELCDPSWDALASLASDKLPFAALCTALRRRAPCPLARASGSGVSARPRSAVAALTLLGSGDHGDGALVPASAVLSCVGRPVVADWRSAALPDALLTARAAFAVSATHLQIADLSHSPTLTREGLAGLLECAPALTHLRVTDVRQLAASPLPWAEVAAMRARSGAAALTLLVCDTASLACFTDASPAAVTTAVASLRQIAGGPAPLAATVAVP